MLAGVRTTVYLFRSSSCPDSLRITLISVCLVSKVRVIKRRTYLGLATAGKWGGGVHRGTINQHLYLSEGMAAKGCWRGERMLRRLQENSLPLPPAPRFSSPLLRSFPFSRSSHFLTLSLLIHAVFLLNKKSKREGLTLWSGGDWKVGERETRTDMRSRRE